MKAGTPPAHLAPLADYVSRTLGLYFPPSRWRDLQRGLESAAGALGFRGAGECSAWFLSGASTRAGVDKLAVYLTISETYFFRDGELFELLESRVLRELADERAAAGRRHLRIWCAGCCTGEEAYSVGIVLHRLLPDVSAWDISLLATDINVDSLAKGRAGVYGAWSFRKGAAWKDGRFFTRVGRERFAVTPGLRKLVTFAYLNLADDVYVSAGTMTRDVDVLVCRNVLMYFDPEMIRRVLVRLASSLTEGGWLIVAPSELSLVPADLFSPVQFGDTIVFRRRGVVAGLTAAPAIMAAELIAPVSAGTGGAAPARRPGSAADAGRGPICADAARAEARACADGGRLAEALSWCERAIAADRVDASGYYLLAMVLQAYDRKAEARAALRKTLYLNPRHIVAHFSLGAIAHSEGDGEGSRRHWGHAAALLEECAPPEIVPESEGITAAGFSALIDALLVRGAGHE